MSSSLDSIESVLEGEYLPEINEYDNDPDSDLSIWDKEEETVQKRECTYFTHVEKFAVSKNTRKKKFNLLFVDHLRCHEFEPSTNKYPPCRVDMNAKSVKSSKVVESVEWCGSENRPAQVLSSSLDHGSKLRGPSPKALV
ncbi:hypothetical protein TNCV_1177731 [Trichonephila clavipes]|nr:hypothetical protein TNCV_1177731 [Trichonephila clavipes]